MKKSKIERELIFDTLVHYQKSSLTLLPILLLIIILNNFTLVYKVAPPPKKNHTGFLCTLYPDSSKDKHI